MSATSLSGTPVSDSRKLGSSRRRKIPASESMVVCGGTGALSSHMMMLSG